MKRCLQKIIESKKTIFVLSVLILFFVVNVNYAFAQEGGGWSLGLFQKGLLSMIDWLGAGFIRIMSLFLWIAGMFLNASILIGIESMSAIIRGSDAIKTGWIIFRDLINILFIFGLLYISIKTILNGWGENSKKMLVNIIMAALLINFSWFITATAIDASNILTIKIHDAMADCPSAGDFINIDSAGVSNCFMNALNLQTTYDKNVLNPDGTTPGPIDLFIFFVISGIFILVAAVIFFAAGVVILLRFITLIILLVTSPVMFLGWIIPKFQKVSANWFSKLSDMLISLPVMFIMIYITYRMFIQTNILSSITGLNPEGNFQAALSIGVGHFGVIINYLIIIGFLIASIVVSQTAGAIGGNAATKIGGNLMFGGAAKVGRRFIGGAGSRVANSKALKDMAASKNLGARLAGKALIRSGDFVSERSFDARKAPGADAALKAANLDVGKAKKGGFKKDVEDRKKRVEKANKLYERDDYSPEELGAVTVDNFEKEIDRIKFQETRRAVESADDRIEDRRIERNQKEFDSNKALKEHGENSKEFRNAVGELDKAQKAYVAAITKKEKDTKTLKTLQENALKLEGAKNRYGEPDTSTAVGQIAKAYKYITADYKSNKEFIKKLEKELSKDVAAQNLDKLIKGVKEKDDSSGGSEKDDGDDDK